MKIIEEIRRQRAILGPAQAERVILSHSAFEQLLAEKDEFVLHQLNTQHKHDTPNRLRDEYQHRGRAWPRSYRARWRVDLKK